MKPPERNRRGPEAGGPGRDIPGPTPLEVLAARHWRWGWWSLWAFLCLGLGLEMLHGFKDPGYVAPSQSTRRLMWTLAHAHGTLLALVQLAFAAFLGTVAGRLGGVAAAGVQAEGRGERGRRWSWASSLLGAAQALLPIGFLLGGWFIRGGDPGLGVFLVPVGALCLVVSVGLIASAAGAAGTPPTRTPTES